MNLRQVYLDNSSTTKVLDEAAQTVFDVMTVYFGNPSSLHGKGIEAEKIMKQAREKVAQVLGVDPGEIYFTSGGTESNNWAIKGAAHNLRRQGNHIITTYIEHPSVLEVFKALENEGFKTTYLKVNKEGFIDISELKNALTPETILASVMYVNNEVGSIQPIEDIAEIIKTHNKNILFHVDAVQAFGKMPLVPNLKGIDLLSLSGHKIYGPKGIGALFVRDKVRIEPLLHGGGQESGLRSGTENMPGIAGLGVAAEACFNNMINWQSKMEELKKHLKDGILKGIPDTVLNGPDIGAPHILNISFLGTKGEILLHALEAKGIYVSTGSACSSHKSGTSHVLRALGKSPEEQDSALRFSLSPFLSSDDMDYTIRVLTEEVNEIRKFVRR
ncbi:Cysteine desulfurase [Tepidanaerobacter acetatoxydans Re1]|uniref:Cysteine desulfurase n=1 Tax=Tepidanaerobacter acetatoxydans (strain DSM 21804 / JCM 16047 / Re1) TaxID=1209989 RepID=F4LWE1_TEPAE|nr:cysteine desulfurase family protein [Tepidanaerobacter acetatoxydans]AEE91739.1 Cysteine desulfurase [Tepidanaerobacter acetatoxydans Re1]CDI40791.1 Cysteine desulfurase [Tepidanaerobacter acetatoxydans Re1]